MPNTRTMMHTNRLSPHLALSAALALGACGGPNDSFEQDVQALTGVTLEVHEEVRPQAEAYVRAEPARWLEGAMRDETPAAKPQPEEKGGAKDDEQDVEPVTGCVAGTMEGHWAVLMQERIVVLRSRMITDDGRELGAAVASVGTDENGNRFVTGKIVDRDGATLGRIEGRWMGASEVTRAPRTAPPREVNQERAPTNEYRKAPAADASDDDERMQVIGYFTARWHIDETLNGTLRGSYMKGRSDLEGRISGGFATDCASN